MNPLKFFVPPFVQLFCRTVH